MMILKHTGRISLLIGLLTIFLAIAGLYFYGGINVAPLPPKGGQHPHWPFVIAPWMSILSLISGVQAYRLKSERISATFGILIFAIWMAVVFIINHISQNYA